MLGRFLIVVTMMLFGPLLIEVQLYHPFIALEHDPILLLPRAACALAVGTGFLYLAAESRLTAPLFALACALAVTVGILGTAFHIAMHARSIVELLSETGIWLGGPPILVPLTFAAAGCLGLIPLAVRDRTRSPQIPPLGRILEGLAAVGGFVATAASLRVEGGTFALFAVLFSLGLGMLGYAIELACSLYPTLSAWWSGVRRAPAPRM